MTQTILISGASSGFGHACAELFAMVDTNIKGQYTLTRAVLPVCQSWASFAINHEQQTELNACDG